MPYHMPFGGQKHKWFTIFLLIGLPFYILYKIIKKDLPSLKDIGRRLG